MSFVKELENKINLYLKNLDKFKEIDLRKVNEVLNKYAEKALSLISACEKEKAEYEKQILNCKNLQKNLSERNYKLSDFTINYGKKIFKQEVLFPDEIITIQNNINVLQQTINEFKGTKAVDLCGVKDFDAIYELQTAFEVRLKDISEKLSAMKRSSIYTLVASEMDEEEIKIYNDYFNALKHVAINLIDSIEYWHLMSVVALSLRDIPFSDNWYKDIMKDSGYSIACDEIFSDIVFRNKYYSSKNNDCFVDNEKVFTDIDNNDKIVYCEADIFNEEGIFAAEKNDYRLKRKKVFSARFLNDLLNLVKESQVVNLPAAAILLANKHVQDNNKSKLLMKIQRFKILYEETPEQVMIRDNRYYEEERMAEIEYQAEQDRKQREKEMEREARWRDEQLEIQREAARAEQQRWEADRRRDEERRKEDARREAKREIRERQEAIAREKREEQLRRREESNARSRAMEVCRGCANYMRCGARLSTPNCSAYTPKR